MKDFTDFLKRNKYIIVCVLVVVLLYATGLIKVIGDFIVLLALVVLAIYIGKRLQDNDRPFKEFFSKVKFSKKDNDDNIYYYAEKKDESSKNNINKEDKKD